MKRLSFLLVLAISSLYCCVNASSSTGEYIGMAGQYATKGLGVLKDYSGQYMGKGIEVLKDSSAGQYIGKGIEVLKDSSAGQYIGKGIGALDDSSAGQYLRQHPALLYLGVSTVILPRALQYLYNKYNSLDREIAKLKSEIEGEIRSRFQTALNLTNTGGFSLNMFIDEIAASLVIYESFEKMYEKNKQDIEDKISKLKGNDTSTNVMRSTLAQEKVDINSAITKIEQEKQAISSMKKSFVNELSNEIIKTVLSFSSKKLSGQTKNLDSLYPDIIQDRNNFITNVHPQTIARHKKVSDSYEQYIYDMQTYARRGVGLVSKGVRKLTGIGNN